MQPTVMLAAIALFVASLGSSSDVALADSSPVNIAFDLPDLTVTLDSPLRKFQLEAYRSTSNDAILKGGSGGKTSELNWVSLGMPEFIRTSDMINPELIRTFHLTPYGFTSYIQMMTEEQRQMLVATVQAKYGVDITENQIVNLILASFQCTLTMYDEFGNAFLLTGVVSDFNAFPLRMDFGARPSSEEYKLFSELINDEDNLEDLPFNCTVQSTGKITQTNTLTISSDQQQLIGFDEKLFGKANNSSGTVFVTRDQMSTLTSEVHTKLNIVEDYDMPEEEFSEKFIDGLLSQVANGSFQLVAIDSVLGSLSKYGFDINADLQPDHITKDAGSILKVQEYHNKSHIVVDEEHYKQLINSNTQSSSTNVQVCGFWCLFKLTVTVEHVRKTESESTTDEHSLSDQLNELNTASRDESEWEFDGDKVIPKSFNVARLSRSIFGNTITFSRIRSHKTSAPFIHRFNIYTRRPPVRPSGAFLNPLSTRIEQIYRQTNQQLAEIRQQSAHGCEELHAEGITASGVYKFYDGQELYCDMTTNGGGWTVFQRRQDGKEDFYRNWSKYTYGFGNLSREFWLGNDHLYALTRTKQYTLRVDLADFKNNTRYAEYSNFEVGPSTDKFRLVSVGTYSGNAVESFAYHVNSYFSTPDQDNDGWSGGSCAATRRGAWWYNSCQVSNLNGFYYGGPMSTSEDGVSWRQWLGDKYSLRFTEMKIKPYNVLA